MPDIAVNETCFQSLFLAACDTEKKPIGEDLGHKLRQWRIEGSILSMRNLAIVHSVTDYASKLCQTRLDDRHNCGFRRQRGGRVLM